MADIKTKLNVGDTVWWVNCSNKVYKGTIKEIVCCDYQGALYCCIYSPSYRRNTKTKWNALCARGSGTTATTIQTLSISAQTAGPRWTEVLTMRLIDADLLEDQFGISDEDLLALDEIRHAPTVDAVVVTRCSDCAHSTLPSELTQRYGKPGTLTCHNMHAPSNRRNVGSNDFCSYGERKDGGDENV